MKLFSKKKPGDWPPVWTYPAEGRLWLFRLNGKGRLIGEARDTERRTASFFCLDERTGAPLWQDLSFSEPWWVGIEEVTDTRVYFHGYRKPDVPRHAGVTAVDIETGLTVWETPDDTYLFEAENRVYISRERFEGLWYCALDAGDGSIVEEFGNDHGRINSMRSKLNEEERFAGYSYPEPYTENNGIPAATRDHIRRVVNPATVQGNLDLMERDGFLFLSWHSPDRADGEGGEILAQHFAALDGESGRALFSDRIDESTIPAPDSFFVKDDLLFYVKNGKILTAHQINHGARA
jgi:outer membrane protein assembly factor BamB